MTEKQIYKLVWYVVAMGANIFNLYHSFQRDITFLLVVSILCMAFFIYMICRLMQECFPKAITSIPHGPVRVPCTYPMNEFYNFEDEIPDGSRCSTVHDCLQCCDGDDGSCDLRHCLIEDGFAPVTESGKWKKCLNHCPACDAEDDDIDWGSKDSDGSTTWQEAECKKCGCVFQEVFDYTSTMVK